MMPEQSKMARAGLGMSVRELADRAHVSTNTISRFEAGEDLKPRTIEAIQRALEEAGVIFVDENGEGPGVRLRKQRPADEGTPVENLNASNDG